MKIAFISYEYPPDTAYGGIATYVYQVARMLHEREHHVEVFTSSPSRCGCENEEGIFVHRIIEEDRYNRRDFANRIAQVFAKRHAEIEFDVVEGAEADAHARGVVQLVPEIPLVVKLHTPTSLVYQINDEEPSLRAKLRWYVGAMRRGRLPKPFPRFHYDLVNDIERVHTLDADEITTPSKALGDKLIELWRVPADRLFHIPNPYIPSQDLLRVPAETHTHVVSFIGRLEIRKGVIELAQAIPIILRHCPDTRFRFVGAIWPSPEPGLDMKQYLLRKLRRYSQSIEFTGSVFLDQIPSVLAETDICVFPSRWEIFPNVCLEAMAAARGIVGSSAGGMPEMLNFGKAGCLVPPYSSKNIAEAVIELLSNPGLRIQLGQTARDRVLTEYNLEKIGVLQEASYQRAIERRRTLGSRSQINLNLSVN